MTARARHFTASVPAYVSGHARTDDALRNGTAGQVDVPVLTLLLRSSPLASGAAGVGHPRRRLATALPDMRLPLPRSMRGGVDVRRCRLSQCANCERRLRRRGSRSTGLRIPCKAGVSSLACSLSRNGGPVPLTSAHGGRMIATPTTTSSHGGAPNGAISLSLHLGGARRRRTPSSNRHRHLHRRMPDWRQLAAGHDRVDRIRPVNGEWGSVP
jgi:hypothetical protein